LALAPLGRAGIRPVMVEPNGAVVANHHRRPLSDPCQIISASQSCLALANSPECASTYTRKRHPQAQNDCSVRLRQLLSQTGLARITNGGYSQVTGMIAGHGV